jgi:hypothetical protein
MNRVVLVGNLTRDPELFHTESGVPYALFRIAVPRNISATKAKEKMFLMLISSMLLLGESLLYFVINILQKAG